MERRRTLLCAALVLIVIGLLPLAVMLGKSLFIDGRATFAVYQKLYAHPARYWTPISHSLALAGLTTAGSTLLGVPLGVLLGKTDLPLRRTLMALSCIPLALPPYVLAVCWFDLIVDKGWFGSLGANQPSAWLFGLPGCVWILVSAFMPVVMILTRVYLHAVNPRLEEAARLIAGWPAVVHHITLPMILPGILFAGMLVFLLALGEIGVPMFLRYSVFPVESLTQFSAFYDFGAATAAATPLLAVVVLTVVFERHYLREKTYKLSPITPARRMLLVPLRRWRLPLVLAVIALAAVTVVLPLLALLQSSLSPFAYPEAVRRGADSLMRSLAFAAIGATLLTVLGFLLGYLIHQHALPLWRAIDTLTLLLFTLPATVVGVGLIAVWNRPATSWLYASPAIVILAYLAQYTALTSRITLATLANVPRSLEEAAQLAGAPWRSRIWRVVVPGALPGLIAAWAIGFVFCMRDLGASLLVYPPGQDTLPVRIFTLMANGAPSLVSALCVLLVVAIAVSLAALGLLLRTVGARR